MRDDDTDDMDDDDTPTPLPTIAQLTAVIECQQRQLALLTQLASAHEQALHHLASVNDTLAKRVAALQRQFN